jgi:hypothetical protein
MINNTFRNISFTSENIEEFIKKYKNQHDLLPLYLDRIRNGYELTEEMLEKINMFDDKSKMKIICEYNRCYKILNSICSEK